MHTNDDRTRRADDKLDKQKGKKKRKKEKIENRTENNEIIIHLSNSKEEDSFRFIYTYILYIHIFYIVEYRGKKEMDCMKLQKNK